MDIIKRLTTLCFTFILLLFLGSVQSVSAQSWPAGIHDPSSIVKDGDTYWIFGTGDGIHTMYSKDLVTWQSGPTPFTKTTFPSWINNYVKGATDGAGNEIFHGGFWAPDIIFMNNRYYLYYSCSEWGTMTSTIGCVTNKTLNPASPDYKWEDVGFLGIWSYQPGLALNAIDPALMRGPDGKIWMAYGSFNQQGIVITEIDSVSGKPKNYAGNLPGISIANSWTGPRSNSYGEGEGAGLVYHEGYYYLFYNKGGCCNGIASSYYMVVGRSTNPRGPYYDKAGKKMKVNGAKSGGTVVLKHDDSRGLNDRYFGPGHFGYFREKGKEYVTFHYYSPNGYYPSEEANNMGGPTLGMGLLKWDEDGWPEISFDFLDDGYYTVNNSNSGKALDAQNHTPLDGANLYQYGLNNLYESQKWRFTALGTGEYTIRNYKDSTLFIEATGENNEASINLTDNYTGAINQKFRLVQSPNGKVLIYPSVSDKIFEIPNAETSDYQVKLWFNTNHECQRWTTTYLFEKEIFNISHSTLTFSYQDTIFNGVEIESNCNWTMEREAVPWLIVPATSGNGDRTVVLIVRKNNSGEDRSNLMTFKTTGGITKSLNVIQKSESASAINGAENAGFEFYPNPTKGLVTFNSDKPVTISIINSTGVEVLSEKILCKTSNINLSDFKPGVYFIKALQDRQTTVKRIVIQ